MKKVDKSRRSAHPKFWSEGTKITGMIIATVLILTLVIMSTITSFAEKKTINSQGEAVVSVMPDIVAIRFAVETRGNTSKEAKDENSEIVNELVYALIEQGFEREDVETMNFNIYEEFDWSEEEGRESIGFKATHDIQVKFEAEEYPELGPIVDAGIDVGALLRYINFELSPGLESEYKAQALELAGADAKLKAEAMVSGVGGRLGKLVSVSESSFGYQPWRAYDMEILVEKGGVVSSEESTPIQIGEREITGRISVVYEIK